MATNQALKYKEQGNAAFKAGDTKKAIEFYTYATEMDPNNPIFYTNRATAYHKMGNFEKALRDATKAVKKDSTWAKGYYRQGLAIEELAKSKTEGHTLDAAAACYKKAWEAAPSDKNYEQCYKQCIAAANADKSKAELLKLSGNELFKAGKQEEAIKHYTKAIEACVKGTEDKMKADILANRAACYRQLYNPDQVVRDCSDALDLTGGMHVKALIRRAQAYEGLERYKKALKDYESALILSPGAGNVVQSVSRLRNALKRMAQPE